MFRKKKDIKKLSDEQLMVSIHHDDTRAFNELYDRYSDRMLYYFYRMLGQDKEMAQDFLQDLFFKVIDKSVLFDPKRKFSTWIYSIAHNMCKNEYRRREVRDILVRGENLDNYEKPASIEKNYPVTADDIYHELDTLDESHRMAFILKYREGFCIDEICEIMNLPKGTVKSRLFYARKKLQDKLATKMQMEIS